MDKNLIKLYIFFTILLVVLVNVFPSIFPSINSVINYTKTKILSTFNNTNTKEINIYEDRANIIIMFDDGWKSQYTVAYNYMSKKKLRGCVAVITKAIEQKNYMTKSDLYILYNNNWDLLNHTYDHKNLNTISEDEQSYEIETANIWLEKNGFINPNKILIYPEGGYNLQTLKIMREKNYVSGRGVEEGFNSKKPTNLYEIKVKNVLYNTNPSEIVDWINYTIDNNLTLILLFHRIEDDVDGSLYMYKRENFYEVIDYIDGKKNNLNVINYSEWIQTIINKD
ncbi:MAG: polysaccharide deacetylase family protein [Bacilli bacterium]|nr:polysaccharide deacetylase family protein [Bacilli bacterium]MDD4407275.1 polysaccharide deacetylase family protein [Bacilli bacterium]